jgi:hypothetical protein
MIAVHRLAALAALAAAGVAPAASAERHAVWQAFVK